MRPSIVTRTSRRSAVLCALALTLLGACKREPEVDLNALVGPMDDLAVTRDIEYAPGDRHGLDIYALRKSGPPRPVVVYIYGGAWADGSKSDIAWVGAALARRGFVAIIPDYRVYPEGLWPTFLEDNAAAVRWAKDNAADFGGDPSAIVLIGHSAGAFNAFSLAVDHRWLNKVGLDPAKDLKAIIGLSGPYRMFPPDAGRETAIFGPDRGFSDPANFVDGKSPPMLLVVGERDWAAGPENTPDMANLVQSKGGTAKAILYPDVSHSETQEAVGGVTTRSSAIILNDITRFLTEHGVTPSE